MTFEQAEERVVAILPAGSSYHMERVTCRKRDAAGESWGNTLYRISATIPGSRCGAIQGNEFDLVTAVESFESNLATYLRNRAKRESQAARVLASMGINLNAA